MNDRKVLEVNNLCSGYGKKVVLQDISFDVKEGDFLGIIGPNGSGKSTLLKTIARILKPFHGHVLFRGQSIHTMTLLEAAKRIALVPQDFNTEFSFTVIEVVLMGRFPHLRRFQQETSHDFEVVRESLELTDSSELVDRTFNELSAGERQRVIIAKAFAQEPMLLLLDEPTSHLDIGHQIEIFDLLVRLNKDKGVTIISVLHDLNLASEYCDRLLLIDKGRIRVQGSTEEVLRWEIIEEVYKTLVVINDNPISSRPHVLLVPKAKKRER